jgi:hypothetical protein
VSLYEFAAGTGRVTGALLRAGTWFLTTISAINTPVIAIPNMPK